MLPLFSVGSTRAATTGLVAAYSFNEASGTTVGDASGTGNNGTASNTTWSTSGKYGGALSFNGTNARVNIPNSSSLQLTTAMTLEAWVNPTATTSKWRDVIYKGKDNYYLEGTSDSAGKPAGGGTFGGASANAYGAAALTANTWSYLALTYDGTTLRLYLNGTLVGSQAKTGAITTSTNQLQIGGDSFFAQYFSGLIDEVRVYNIALSAAALQTDMNTPISTSTDGTPPSAPGTLTASAVNANEIDLAWGVATDNVGVTGYQIFRCQNAGCTSYALLASPTGTATTYKDTSVAASTAYGYEVRATDAAGNLGPFSNSATATTPASTDTTPPSAPGTLAAHAVSAGEIDLTWGAASDNVGVTGYEVFRCTGAACGSFTKVGQAGGGTTTYSDTGLTAATSYSYEVRALDAAGNTGPFSNTVSAATSPSNSSGVVAAYGFNEGTGTTVADASGNGNGGTVSNTTWAPAGKYGGALSFNGTNARVNIPSSTSLQLTNGMTLEAWVNPTTTSSAWRDIIYKGVDNYYLEGTSEVGGSAAGGGTFGGGNANAFAPSPLAAGAWSYLALTYDGATLRFYVNGALVASQAAAGAITASTNPLQIGGDSLFGQYFSGLIDEVRIYKVALSQAAIQADMSSAVSSGGTDSQPPSAPGTLTASVVNAGEIDLSWGAATDNVGVTGYQVERCSGVSCSNFAQVTAAAGTVFNDTTVAASTSYTYRVRATDAAGNLGPYTNTAGGTTPASDSQPPSQPGTLSVSAAGAGEIDLGWGAATDNVGVTGYRIERCTAVGCNSFAQIATASGLSYKDTTVAASTSYSYRVRASDAAGNLGPYSNTATASTPASPLGLVAAYGFDEGSGTTVTDASGNGNNGTVANGTWATTGEFGKAIQFNGTSTVVNIPDATSLHLTTGMTLEAWVNPSTVDNNWRDVIYKANDNYYLEATSDNAARPDAGLIAGGIYGDAYGTSALAANTWSFLAETYDGATLRLYVNGVQVAATAHTGSISTSTNPLQIGGDTLYGQYFRGLIDNVRVYNTALTPAQIQTDQGTSVNSVLSAPGTLTANAVSSTEVDLSWGPATGGATSYLVERCAGAGCSNFTQIGTSPTTTFNDTSVGANSYSYRVRATDTAGDLGAYSNVATTTTGLSVSPNNAVLTFSRTQQYTAQGPGSSSVTWQVDGVAGGSASTGRITSGGVYTPPSAAGTHTIAATNGTTTASVTVYVSNDPGTFTFHNDNMRDGANLNETVLTPANVNSSSFGKVFSYPLDGLTFASPLYVQNVNVPGQGFHNVVVVATEHDSVYAFDADGRSNSPIWKDSFINPAAGVTPIPPAVTGETGDIPNEIGITGTPVIDPSTNTIYVVAATQEVSGGKTSYVNRLHALDLTTGAEKFGGPIVIQASVPGNGGDSVNGTISFNNITANQRPALTLQNGEVYIGFSNHGNNPPYHGWLMAYNASTLHQDWVFCTTPNAMKGGIWMGGGGIGVDASGNLYFSTGNGTFDGPSSTGGSNDFGDSLLKLNPSGARTDFFTPYNYSALDSGDVDLASGGIILLPDQPGPHPHEVIAAGKGGTVYLVDRDSLGGVGSTSDNQIVQSLINVFPTGGGDETGNYSAPVYYNGTVYFAPVDGPLMAFSLTSGRLSTSPTSESPETYDGSTGTFTARGGEMALSANGSSNGILWGLQSNGDSSPGTLHAYDPSNLGHEYYTSDQAGTRDQLDPWLKFTLPLVANGRVYVVASGQLTAYGLLP